MNVADVDERARRVHPCGMKKYEPFATPPGAMPVRPVGTVSRRDPNFYEDASGEAPRGEPMEPMELDLERDMPAPRATTGGMPYKLDGGGK